MSRLVVLLALVVPVLSFGHQLEPARLTVGTLQEHVYQLSWQSETVFEIERPETCERIARHLGNPFNREVWRCANDETDTPTIGLNFEGPALLVRWTDDDVAELLSAGQHQVSLFQPELELASYFVLGIQHIAAGYDHLLFVLCLMLIAGSPKRLLLTITGFTVAHSVTLALTSLGLIRLSITAVETIIALSIVWLARELLQQSGRTLIWRQPIIVAMAIGLLHGLGFANAVLEFGLPETSRIGALALFNLGVEAGQILFVGIVLVVFLVIRKAVEVPNLRPAVGYSVGVTAMFWTLERLM